jgi:hypothetical protein
MFILSNSTCRTAVLLLFVCSACKPLFNTDSLPANPEKVVNLGSTYSQGRIAIAPPVGWQPVKVTNMKYPIFRPSGRLDSLSIVEENAPGSLEAFIQTNLQGMAIAFQNWRQISQAEFQTTKGMGGKVIVIQSQQLNVALHQRLYFFAPDLTKGYKLILVCGGKPEAALELEATCDASIKTLMVSP